MLIRTFINASQDGRLIKSTRNYLGKKLLSDDYRVTRTMAFAEESIVPKIKDADYVRTASIELLANEIRDKEIHGSIAELGVFQGHLASVLNQVFFDRTLYLFDTFEGFDKKDIDKEIENEYSKATQDFSNTSVEMVMNKMVYPEKVKIRKGWFPHTVEGLEHEEFAFVSIDADLYQPIYEGLEYFFPRLAKGGAIFVHDYNNLEYKGARKAVRGFCKDNEISYFPLCDECGSAVILR